LKESKTRRNDLIKKIILLTLFSIAFYVFPVLADEEPAAVKPEAAAEIDNSGLRNATIIILTAWFGIAAYLFRLDRKISKLEKELHEK
jgi:CcmD family protein